MFKILLVIILLLLTIILIFIIIISFSEISFIIYNIETTNYVKIKTLLFTIELNYEQFLASVKNIGINNDLSAFQVIKLLKNTNPFIKDIMNITTVKKAIIHKYFDEYSETYGMITFYLLSSYFNSFLSSNFKNIDLFNSQVLYSRERKDFDFSLVLKITIFHTLIVMLKNIKILTKYIKRRNAYGS